MKFQVWWCRPEHGLFIRASYSPITIDAKTPARAAKKLADDLPKDKFVTVRYVFLRTPRGKQHFFVAMRRGRPLGADQSFQVWEEPGYIDYVLEVDKY